jgi:hypothetical protein
LPRQRKDDAVCANAKVAIAPGHRLLRTQHWHWLMAVVYQNKIVAQAVVLAEFHTL